ncbi:MAG: DUF285 domain-containing protein [Succinivibrio sp.]|nr:DUF285 domain-containing protein [Succinivibrio sp.]
MGSTLKLKDKLRQELLLALQQGLPSLKDHAQGELVFEDSAPPEDGRRSFSAAVPLQLKLSSLSEALKKKLPPKLLSAQSTLGQLKVGFVSEQGLWVLHSEDLSFTLEDNLQGLFSDQEEQLLKLLAARLINFKALLRKLDAGAAVSWKLKPQNVLALRLFAANPGVLPRDIDISALDDLSYAFALYENGQVVENPRRDFTGIEAWDVSKITNMQSMFAGCIHLNADLSAWHTAALTNTELMFASCREFNSPLESFDTSQVTNMRGMFYKCHSFDQPLAGWDVSKVKSMAFSFYECRNFNQDLSSWDTTALREDERIFDNCIIATEYKPPLPSTEMKVRFYEKYYGPKTRARGGRALLRKILLTMALGFILIALLMVLHR